jgi:putative SOS response-associated peptidase YedK
MCGRVTLTSSGAELAAAFALDAEQALPELAPRYNIAPSQDVATVRCNREGKRELSFERWGLVPHWAKDPSIGNRMINARSESAGAKPAFRDALRARRCIVPVDGFYEWKGARGERTPYLFRRADRALFGLAGLYERWLGEGGEVVDSCTILTTEANDLMRAFHDRMPVVLARDDYSRWLDRETEDVARLSPLLVPCPNDWLTPVPVSRRINDPKNDDAACLVPEPRTGDLFGQG